MLIKTRIDNEQKYVKISEPRMDEFLNSAFIKFSIPPVSEGIRVYDETGPEVDADVFEEVAQLPNAVLLDELTNSALEPLACSSNDTFMEDESPSRKRQKTDDDAKRLVKSALTKKSGGDRIINQYNRTKGLTDSTR
ncbi:Transcription antitermination protein NusB [Dissostichus eleginoides]|uniref:Transcription antitermination protein NusB n=1 Tax=Dissostichus eleginoides TaxID=100907 RepID=A0AAD9CFM2_DISEL|nr:Transcription antitermination protein NusB [Dissostichus eleginoides]